MSDKNEFDKRAFLEKLRQQYANDPRFEAGRQEFAREAMPLLEAMRSFGLELDNVKELEALTPLSVEIVRVFLDCLPRISSPKVLDWMVRMVVTSKGKYDARPLLELFDRTEKESLKGTIGLVIVRAKAQGVEAWLAGAILDPRHGNGRNVLCDAVARRLPKEQARTLLTTVFDQFPYRAALGLARCGNRETIPFLQARVNNKYPYRWYNRQIEKTIEKIKARENIS